jgi:hypothetical protein
MLLCGFALLGYAVNRYLPRGALRLGGTPAPASSAAVTLRLLYGTEKERWLQAAVAEFVQGRPDVKVELQGMGTIDSVRAIAEGRETPVVWSPADEIAVNLLDAEWALAKGGAIVDRSADLQPEPLVLTPLVMIAWEERAKRMAGAGKGEPADWHVVHSLATSPRGWLSIGGPAEWGYVKLGHTAPNASNSGLQALVLMAYSYHRKTSNLKPQDILDEAFQKWMLGIESAVGKFGSSSGTYMKEMILYGPSKYDAIWNYESVAIGDMGAAQGRWGNLAVYYPTPTLWSNHPFVVLSGSWVTSSQRAAARDLRAHLLSLPVQRKALESGFRPANPDVKLLTEDATNPWNRWRGLGVRVDVPAVADPPSGEVTRLLLETWRRVVETRSR